LKELIALAKSKPGEILYASTGVGTAPHLAAELFSVRAGVKLVYVPYQGRSAGGYRSAGRAHRRHVLARRTKSRKLRLKPAHQSLITDVSGFASTVARSSNRKLRAQSARSRSPTPQHLTKDIRAIKAAK
jgi:hypothetical protein